jgi:predicted small secreted protein
MGDITDFLKGPFMVRKFVAIALVVAGLGVSACNTVEGAGRDVSSAGSAVSDAAREAK